VPRKCSHLRGLPTRDARRQHSNEARDIGLTEAHLLAERCQLSCFREAVESPNGERLLRCVRCAYTRRVHPYRARYIISGQLPLCRAWINCFYLHETKGARKGARMSDWKVQGTRLGEGANPTWIGEGIAVPSSFQLTAVRGALEVGIAVGLTDGRLRAYDVRISTTSDRGVTAAMLRSVPIRSLIIEGALELMSRVKLGPKGVANQERVRRSDAEAVAAVEAAVGYVEAIR
jgi:hypothetical protein